MYTCYAMLNVNPDAFSHSMEKVSLPMPNLFCSTNLLIESLSSLQILQILCCCLLNPVSDNI